MKTIIELILEMAGYLILLFAVVWAFVHFTGYGKYYDKMLEGDVSKTTIYDNESDNNNNKKGIENNKDNIMIHHKSIKKTNSKCKQSY
ncbi:MAG: hypothetical protein JZU53_12420 [Paludibacter sp.]|nr:hypothetical protein [Paludibacter sp.]